MNVRDVMTTDVTCISPDATLQEAAQKMRSLDVGSLPICDNDRLAGMITDRDITIRAIADGCDPTQTPVRQAMSKGVAYCFEDDDLQQVEQIMKDKQIRRLPVLNRSKRLVGIVSLGDLALTADEQECGEVLERISEPAHAH